MSVKVSTKRLVVGDESLVGTAVGNATNDGSFDYGVGFLTKEKNRAILKLSRLGKQLKVAKNLPIGDVSAYF